MKKLFVFFLIFFSKFLYSVENDPLIIAILMVKNEEEVMEKTMQPLVEGGIDAFFIYDTGSTDRTIEVTEQFFKKHNLTKTSIVQEPFVDFAASRNRALDLTEECFPEAGFLLMLDAEWYLVNADKLVEFCKWEPKNEPNIDFYNVRIISNHSIDFYAGRLLRNHSKIRFKGEVHEALIGKMIKNIPKDIIFYYKPNQTGTEKSISRWKKDIEILLKNNEENPNHPRTLFYLAQTYSCLGDLENAALFWKERTKISGWDEENF